MVATFSWHLRKRTVRVLRPHSLDKASRLLSQVRISHFRNKHGAAELVCSAHRSASCFVRRRSEPTRGTATRWRKRFLPRPSRRCPRVRLDFPTAQYIVIQERITMREGVIGSYKNAILSSTWIARTTTYIQTGIRGR
jgi:hypothetical protein